MSFNNKDVASPSVGGFLRPDQPGPTDWTAYSSAYDLLSMHNPAYQALMQDFAGFLATIGTPQRIYDIGGGTGNYTGIAARACPDSEIHLVEPDAAMIRSARTKLSAHSNINFHNLALE
ncbi:class I SAM-dependent methyltransferase, partial [Sulfitobacter sp. 915]|uniref:class I SAM-dependent methyltransferase n=1 Tax=Sulfitobacter sp. 915 TaxID=3368558 RepID=UPI0037463FF4